MLDRQNGKQDSIHYVSYEYKYYLTFVITPMLFYNIGHYAASSGEMPKSSYLTNTLSFMRVGAYAITHVGLMLVVHMLAGLAGGVGGPAGILILVLGNAFVMGFEGLLVGIQVLRLEFYELFGRFYDDGGIPFVPKKIDYAARTNG